MKKLLLIAALIIAPALYFFLGYYDVSATKPHSEIVNMMLGRITGSSIRRNARSVETPYDVNDENMYVKGFREYEGMCVGCHGAPGGFAVSDRAGTFSETAEIPGRRIA